MPAIHEKHKCTSGEIFCFANAVDKWYIRVYVKEERKYRYKLIPGATTAIEALQNVDKIEVPSATYIPTVLESTQQYIQYEEQRHSLKQLAENTIIRKRAFIKRFNLYCDAVNLITLDQLSRASFNNWPIFFKVTSKLTLSQDYKGIKHWLNYLISNELIKTDPVVLPRLTITDEDLSANPPLSEHDWNIVLRYINQWEKQAIHNPNWRGQWWRYQFRHFIHIAKRSGLRPSELCSLRWCDVEIIDDPHSIQDDARATLRVRKSKTHSSRAVPTNMGRELKRLKQWQSDHLKQWQLGRTVRSEDLIFVDVDGKGYSVPAFSKCWRDYIMPAVVDKLEGDRDYGRKFTLYSLRSSYINDQLRAGVDVFLLSKACGHSVKTLMRYYERFDTTTREDELAHLPIGETKKKGSVVRSTM